MEFKIKNADFIKSFADGNVYPAIPSTIPEICVVGRSNVGKSTFINMLVGKRIAQTSSQPGRTRLINVFGINDGQLNLIDLPGYGYAVAPKSQRDKWGAMIEGYLTKSNNLKQVFALVDIRHDPTELDKTMLMFLYHYGLPFTVIATKADKLSKVRQKQNIMRISTVLGVGRDDIIPVSGLAVSGREAVLDRIGQILEQN